MFRLMKIIKFYFVKPLGQCYETYLAVIYGLRKFVNYGRKEFHDIGPWSNIGKPMLQNFYGCYSYFSLLAFMQDRVSHLLTPKDLACKKIHS